MAEPRSGRVCGGAVSRRNPEPEPPEPPDPGTAEILRAAEELFGPPPDENST